MTATKVDAKENHRKLNRDMRKVGYSTRVLGAGSAELAALSFFFEDPWVRPIDTLTESAQASLLNTVGFLLRSLGRPTEAVEPMESSLWALKEKEKWAAAARVAGNLSELYVVLGAFADGERSAREAVELADASREAFERMKQHAKLADALHQLGRLREAEEAFRQAEEIQANELREHSILYSMSGFKFGDLLLDQGEALANGWLEPEEVLQMDNPDSQQMIATDLALERFREVFKRSSQTIDIAEWKLDIALDHLNIGRAATLEAVHTASDNFSEAVRHLDEAVDGLRADRKKNHIPRGLLARAALLTHLRNWGGAESDLNEAMDIARNGRMLRYLADIHLAKGKLRLEAEEIDAATESLATARKLIEQMGYQRRVPELLSLLQSIDGESGNP